VSITRNLSKALEQLQERTEIKWLWADGLCINQSDREEGDSQFKRMSAIYKASRGVYAWLGPEGDGSAAVMNAINSAGRLLFLRGYFASKTGRVPTESNDEYARLHPKFEETIFRSDLITARDPIIDVDSGMHMLLDDQEREFQMLSVEMQPILQVNPGFQEDWATFCARPIWNRRWVLQELVLARPCFLLCGRETARFEFLLAIICFMYWCIALHKKIDVVEQLFSYQPVMSESPHMLTFIWDYLRQEDSTDAAPLYGLLRDVWNLQTSFHNDQIHALLGIASDTSALGIEVDRQQPLEVVGEDLMRRSLLQYGLRIINFPSKYDPKPGWPSWVTSQYDLSGSDRERLAVNTNRTIFLNRQDLDDFNFSASGPGVHQLSHENFKIPRIFQVGASFIGNVSRR
jgi:hypothetical protein